MLKKSNKNIFILLILILIISFLSIVSITSGFKSDLETSLRILLKQPALFFRTNKFHDNRLIDYTYKLLNGLNNRIFNNHTFEKIKININFSELQKLQKDREKALKKNKLSNAKFANITVDYKGNTYKAKARLKGDLSQHYGSNKQWSLKLEFKDDKSIFGMQQFALSIFTQRDYPYNFVYYDIFQKFGLISPRFKIIKVNFNGDDWGLMLLEEQFSSSFYAFNKLKETPIVRMTNENDFEIIQKSQKIDDNIENLTDILRWQGKFETKIYNEKKISKKTSIPNLETNLNLISFFKTIQEESYSHTINSTDKLVDYLNIEKFAKALAITLVFGDNHSVANNNSRYYINPYTIEIEPILTDLAHTALNDRHIKKVLNENYGSFYTSLYENKFFQETYFKTLLDIQKEFYIIEDKLNEICSKFGKNCFNEIDKGLVKNNLEKLVRVGKNIFSYVKKNDKLKSHPGFNTKNKFDLIDKKIHFRVFNDNSIDLLNLTSENIKINNIKFFKNKKCVENCNYSKPFDLLLKPSSFEKVNKSKIQLKEKFINFTSIEIFYSDENGNNFSVVEKVENNKFSFKKYKDTYFEDKNNILIPSQNNLIIKKGNYNITEPIIIPDGMNLIIEPGAQLDMNTNTYIFVSNGDLKIKGEPNNKVFIFNSNNDYWKGIFVRSNNIENSDSNITDTIIKNYTFFDNGLVQLTGGINFYNTNITIKNLNLEKSLAEDGLNIVNSKFKIKNIKISEVSSDAIDVDFSKGQLEDTEFINIGGDAIDFSGSNSNILDTRISDVQDKAISVGEKSIIKLQNINITKSSIGIASKDSSKVFGENVIISNCKLHDYASFQKKSFFKNGFIELKNSKGCNKELVDKNSFLSINGKVFKGKEIDIKKEYY